MIEESIRVRIEGHLLHRLILHPHENRPVSAQALFYHGQGDYAERYAEVLHPFTERGIRCFLTELPGHGYSPGRRGHCGSTALLDAIIDNTIDAMGVRDGSPYGVMGHSMGGLLAVRHLILAGQRHFPQPAFAWLSSPLIHPGNGRAAFYLKMIRWLAAIMPSLTVSTGVKPEMCRVKHDDGFVVGRDHGEPEPKHRLWHSRVSAGWGAALLDYESFLAKHVHSIPDHIPILYTQGGRDPICLPVLARQFFNKLPNYDKQYDEFKELLHEPFRGEGSESLFAALEQWLDQLDLSAKSE